MAGSPNQVAGPYLNVSTPEPTGVVAILAPAAPSLLGLVSVLAPVIATGNTAVLAASQAHPLPAITLAEVLATSDVPGGVVNILTGDQAELAPVLAGHMDVDAIDVTGAGGDTDTAAELERLAAGNLKRVFRGGDDDWSADPGTRRLTDVPGNQDGLAPSGNLAHPLSDPLSDRSVTVSATQAALLWPSTSTMTRL